MNTTTYNIAGHVCPTTGRIAMTVAEAYARPDMPDRHFCLYNAESEGYGMDPWLRLDGMDMTTGTPVIYTLDFPNGRSINVQGSTIVYMQRTKAERAEAITLSPTIDDALSMALAGTLRPDDAAASRTGLWIVDLHASGGAGGSITLRGIDAATSAQAEAKARAMMTTPEFWHCTAIDREHA